jgi:hypothetical protein
LASCVATAESSPSSLLVGRGLRKIFRSEERIELLAMVEM